MSQTSDSCLDTWMGREALAEAMIPVIGRLYRENNVVTSVYGRSLINKSTMNILKAHRFARRMSKDELLLTAFRETVDEFSRSVVALLDDPRPFAQRRCAFCSGRGYEEVRLACTAETCHAPCPHAPEGTLCSPRAATNSPFMPSK